MLLAIDIGNSQTSFGLFEDSRLTQHWRFETRVSRSADEYASLVLPLFQRAGISIEKLEGVAIASVVPPSDPAIEAFCAGYLDRKPVRIDVRSKLKFKVQVRVPTEVGADRLANAAYAIENLSLPAIVIDCGTATTFDVISADRAYEGGIILPGVRISAEALSSRTSKLPRIDLEFPEKVIGKDTVQCIQSGILYGYLDLIDGLIDRTRAELSGTATVVLTGGLSRLFAGRLRNKAQYLPNLTLEGIRIVYLQNRG